MITDEGKDLNKFQYMMKMAGKSLCRSIYTYIENNEASNRPYTIQDIRSYMERGFNILKKKHPMLPDDMLDKCIQYVVKKKDNEYKIFFLRGEINENTIRRIVKEEIEKTLHFRDERGDRMNAIEELGGYGKSVCKNIVDRGHKNGPELFVLTDNAIIKVYNAETLRHVTDLIARPEQIIDRMGSSLSKLDRQQLITILNIARSHHEKGYNYR
jgi:hypothetical protein